MFTQIDAPGYSSLYFLFGFFLLFWFGDLFIFHELICVIVDGYKEYGI